MKLFLFLIAVVIPSAVNAQFPPPPVGLPIDGGLIFLVSAAAIYGANKLHKKS